MGKTRRKGDRGECVAEDGEQKLYLQEPLLECRVPEPDLIFLSDLPGGLDFNEWLASHTIGFFEHVNLTYGTVSEYCTSSSCPEMVGPGPRNYVWIDDKGKKCKLSAPQYVDYVMTFCQRTINDESVFPTKHGNEFPPNFESQYIRKIFRLLFQVMAHVYHSHFREIVLLQLHAHLNALFAHFVGFSVKFNLLEEKELEVLADLIVALKIVPPSQDGKDKISLEPSEIDKRSGVALSMPNPSSGAEENKENEPDVSSAGDVITVEPQASSSTTNLDPESKKALPPHQMEEGVEEANGNENGNTEPETEKE